MAYPTHNQSFEKGNFSGFRTSSPLCRVVRSFAPWSGGRIEPIHGRYLARIDDPAAVDADGSRTPPAAGQAVDATGLVYRDEANNFTYGVDGAWVECDLSLGKQEKLVFTWLFVGYDALPYNDFAYFAVYDGYDTTAPPTQGSALSDLLAADQAGRQPRRWRTNAFAPGRAFAGVVRWYCCNGYSAAPASVRPAVTRKQRARPSVLLLDSLHISK